MRKENNFSGNLFQVNIGKVQTITVSLFFRICAIKLSELLGLYQILQMHE